MSQNQEHQSHKSIHLGLSGTSGGGRDRKATSPATQQAVSTKFGGTFPAACDSRTSEGAAAAFSRVMAPQPRFTEELAPLAPLSLGAACLGSRRGSSWVCDDFDCGSFDRPDANMVVQSFGSRKVAGRLVLLRRSSESGNGSNIAHVASAHVSSVTSVSAASGNRKGFFVVSQGRGVDQSGRTIQEHIEIEKSCL